MLDRQSLIVTYDERRGEPRGKKKRAAGDVALPVLADERGDCIDCRMCVTTCPTGIDIRNGLQMECVGCAQCIDACDAVMEKIGRPRGLIRYSSMAAVSGEKSRLLRPRIVVYPLVMVVLVGIFGALLTSRTSAEAAILPRQGSPFYALESGEIANQVRLRIVNRSLEDATYTVSVAAPEGARIDPDHPSLTLTPTASETVGFVVAVPASLMGPRGRCDVSIVVRGSDGYEKTLEFHALGPVHRSAP